MKTIYLIMDCDHVVCGYPTEAEADAHLAALRAQWVAVDAGLSDVGSINEVPQFDAFTARDFGTLEIFHQSQYLPEAESLFFGRQPPKTGAYAPSATCKHGVHPMTAVTDAIRIRGVACEPGPRVVRESGELGE